MLATYADLTGAASFALSGGVSLKRARRLQCCLFRPRHAAAM